MERGYKISSSALEIADTIPVPFQFISHPRVKDGM